jgi:hypothetical protein
MQGTWQLGGVAIGEVVENSQHRAEIRSANSSTDLLSQVYLIEHNRVQAQTVL